jgi:hypothetical protein
MSLCKSFISLIRSESFWRLYLLFRHYPSFCFLFKTMFRRPDSVPILKQKPTQLDPIDSASPSLRASDILFLTSVSRPLILPFPMFPFQTTFLPWRKWIRLQAHHAASVRARAFVCCVQFQLLNKLSHNWHASYATTGRHAVVLYDFLQSVITYTGRPKFEVRVPIRPVLLRQSRFYSQCPGVPINVAWTKIRPFLIYMKSGINKHLCLLKNFRLPIFCVA